MPQEEDNTISHYLTELTAFQRDCLRHVAKKRSSKGLDIKESLSDEYGAPVNHSRLYPNLDELVDIGLVRKGKIDNRTNSYKVTDEGQELVEYLSDTWTL